MPQFILAFPMNCGIADSISVTENVSISAETKKVLIPGCSVQFSVVRRDAVPELLGIFKEHQDISQEAATAIESHKSLLFFLGEVKSIEEVSQVNNTIFKMFDAGAQGVYMQQSGAAWSEEGFRDEILNGEYPMDPWINFIENEGILYTLGMACFALPDLSISMSIDEAQEALLLAADKIFGEGIPAKSGAELVLNDEETFILRQEPKSLFPKDSPEYNKSGVLRMNLKK